MTHRVPRESAPLSLAGLKVQFYGLGALGSALANRLVSAGASVEGIDTDAIAQARWTAIHGSVQETEPAVIVLCVTDEAASLSVIDSALGSWPRGALLIEHGTVSPASACRTASRCRNAGLRYADAPLSGGVEGARRGEMVAMVGTDPSDQSEITRVLAAYCAQVIFLGNAGAGQTCKLANQLAIAGIAAGLASARQFSLAAGLNLEQVFAALSLGSARSVQLDRLQSALSRPDTDTAELFTWLRKDLDLCAKVSDQSDPLVKLWRTLWDTDPLPPIGRAP
jgi:3-hydroxyisobutyrate dehydrogenase-like beta-hydroxyacid dehydrogenase